MQIKTACPKCCRVYEVEGEYEGSEVQCENCGCQFVVECNVLEKVARTKQKRRGKSTCFVPWLVLFAIQFVGYLVGCLVNVLIAALAITFMIDDTWIIISVQVLSALLCTSMASYLAFSHLVIKMIAKRNAKE